MYFRIWVRQAGEPHQMAALPAQHRNRERAYAMAVEIAAATFDVVWLVETFTGRYEREGNGSIVAAWNDGAFSHEDSKGETE